MKQKILVALAAFVLAVLVHGYLTMHYYPLVLGLASGPSICNISSQMNCDAVTASAFSAVFGIPVAAFGLVFNALLFILGLMTWLGLRGDAERSWRDVFWLSLVSVITSVVMGAISVLFIGSYCLFCIIAYVLSFIAFGAVWTALPSSPWLHLGPDVASWFGERRSFLMWLAAVPIGAGLIHISFKQSNSADRFESLSKIAVDDWEAAPVVKWTATPSLAKGASAEAATMVITEFADFLCGHCKNAAPSLGAFVAAHPGVRLVFYSFPLDSTCNSKLERGTGVSCRLAKSVYCAEQQKLGWALHDKLFEKQYAYQGKTAANVDAELQSDAAAIGVDWANLEACMNDPQTDTVIRAQADQGHAAGVRGTPAIYVNGKSLDLAALILSLNMVRERLGKSK
jgi:protein-disulfide isomerase/uncharacterized membrane protein